MDCTEEALSLKEYKQQKWVIYDLKNVPSWIFEKETMWISNDINVGKWQFTI